MGRILANSENYYITHEWESAHLIHKTTKKQIIIGDFYGDPECAFISKDESYCITGGCGFIIYFLEKPFIDYEYNKTTKQWKEFKRGKDDNFWVENIYIGNSENEIHLVVEPENNITGGVYAFYIDNYNIHKIKAE